jgi:hypothetical protein
VTAAAAFALAKAHNVEVALDGGKIAFRSRGSIRPDVLASLRRAAPDMLAALRSRGRQDGLAALPNQKSPAAPNPTSDNLLEALRARGFVISLTGSDRDLRDIVAERRPLFERLLAWQAPGESAATARQHQGLKR